ncbi:MAG: hypothetical protein MUD01_03640 [Chloroflexaceae bacterium]|nr:hypothetical protein [Chloroflexaceae bacterium]
MMTESAVRWNVLHRLLFRFAFLYGLLYMLPIPKNWIELAVPTVAQRLFGVVIVPVRSGSGDKAEDYVLVFCLLVLALGGSLIWSLLDWKRANYTRLTDWFHVLVRCWLAFWLIAYGCFKVINTQFGSLPLSQLLQPLGESSPMGLLWKFMAASESYTVFTGAAELLAGWLLVFRRTALLGALVSVAVMSNVVVLNFSYDVPVKITSLHMLLAALLLLLPEARRLAAVFLFNQPAPPSPLRPIFTRPWLQRGSLVVAPLLALVYTGGVLAFSYQTRVTSGDWAPRPALHGIWQVDEFRLGGGVSSPTITDPFRWQRFVVNSATSASLQMMDSTVRGYALELSPETSSFDLRRGGNPFSQGSFSYQQPEPDRLILEGVLDRREVRVVLRRENANRFPLVSRGFNWVTELPFNQ